MKYKQEGGCWGVKKLVAEMDGFVRHHAFPNRISVCPTRPASVSILPRRLLSLFESLGHSPFGDCV